MAVSRPEVTRSCSRGALVTPFAAGDPDVLENEGPMRNAKTARDRFLVGFSGVLLAGAVSYGADAPVTLAVRPTVLFAGRDVRTTVRTPRDARNRELRIVVEAADYYASSDVQLDGDDAPATHQFTWKELPGGAYRVEAILTREDGERKTVSECFAVLGLDDSADAMRGPPKRSGPPDAGAGRSGC
jgi:hypothetical protein